MAKRAKGGMATIAHSAALTAKPLKPGSPTSNASLATNALQPKASAPQAKLCTKCWIAEKP